LAYELTDEEVTGVDAAETTDLHVTIPITQHGKIFKPKPVDPQNISRDGNNPPLDSEIVSMSDHERYELRRCVSITLA
jgi:hypothetical protein